MEFKWYGCSRLALAVVLNNIERLAWFQWFKSLDKRLTSYDWYVTLEHINHLTSGLCFLEQIRPFFAEYFVTFVRGEEIGRAHV